MNIKGNMKIKEAIVSLSELPQEYELLIDSSAGEYGPTQIDRIEVTDEAVILVKDF